MSNLLNNHTVIIDLQFTKSGASDKRYVRSVFNYECRHIFKSNRFRYKRVCNSKAVYLGRKGATELLSIEATTKWAPLIKSRNPKTSIFCTPQNDLKSIKKLSDG